MVFNSWLFAKQIKKKHSASEEADYRQRHSGKSPRVHTTSRELRQLARSCGPMPPCMGLPHGWSAVSALGPNAESKLEASRGMCVCACMPAYV